MSDALGPGKRLRHAALPPGALVGRRFRIESAIGEGSDLSGGNRSMLGEGAHTTAPARAPASERTYGGSNDFVITTGAVLPRDERLSARGPSPFLEARREARRRRRGVGAQVGPVGKKITHIVGQQIT